MNAGEGGVNAAPPTWADLRAHAESRLRDTSALRPENEARWMVERVSGYDGAELLTQALGRRHSRHGNRVAPNDVVTS